MSAMTRHLPAIVLVSAVVVGLLLGVNDTRITEVQSSIMLLGAAGVLLGAMDPAHALRTGLLLGLGVPIVHAYVRLAGVPLPYPVASWWTTFLALVPPVVGAAVGGAVSRGGKGSRIEGL